MVKRGAAAVGTAEPSRPKRRRGAAVSGDCDPASSADDGQDRQHLQDAGALHGGPAVDVQLDPALLMAYAAQAAAVMAASGAVPDAQDKADEQDRESADSGDANTSEEPSVPDIQVAAARLVELTGISLETALNALKETQDSVFGEAASARGSALLRAWVDEAQVWLACGMEVQGEIEEVRIAMHESLQEYESAKAADDVPLAERPADFLRDRFMPAAAAGASRSFGRQAGIVFRHVAAFACHRALFAAGAHKAPLVKLADLERNCRRWYPNKGTERFWEQVAEECSAECTAAATKVDAAAEELTLKCWIGCDQGPTSCTVCAAALAEAEGCAGPSTSAPAAAAGSGTPRSVVSASVGAAVLAAVGNFAAQKADEVEKEVCKMPAVPGEVPELFAVLDDPPGGDQVDSSDAEVIECVGDATGSGRACHPVLEL